MTRVKRGKTSLKRRRNVLEQTKGYRFGRKSKERSARQALFKAGTHAFSHRKKKKGDFRRLWQIKINAAAREQGISYSRLMDKMKKANIALDRKIMANLAEHKPEIFKQIVENITK